MHRAWSKCSNSSWTARPNSYSGRSWKRATSHHCTTLPHNDVFLEIIIIYPCFHGCWLRSACNTNARLRNRREGGEFEAERHGYKGDVYKRRSTHTTILPLFRKKTVQRAGDGEGKGALDVGTHTCPLFERRPLSFRDRRLPLSNACTEDFLRITDGPGIFLCCS